jgi:NAD(P)-dependent dehydrogenase (short-subunit alcohol dehydrogenase family)
MNVMERFSLKNKIALITGGGGLYGKQSADALCEAGAKLYLASRSMDKAAAQVQAMREKGYAVETIEYDQGDEESIQRVVNHVMDQEGRIDILVNAARVLGGKGGWEQTEEGHENSVKVNSLGFLLLVRLVGNMMMRQKSGVIINFGSMMGSIGVEPRNYEGFPDMRVGGFGHDYFFNKSGINAFTRQAASYYGPYGIRVNCISPGGIVSERTPDKFIENYSKHTILNRLANDDDVKGVLVFLASEASSYITGANILLDGGYTVI